MKMYVRGNSHKSIPTIEFDITIFDLAVIHASQHIYGGSENLPVVKNKNNEVTDEAAYKVYRNFLVRCENYLRSLNYEDFEKHGSAKSASTYYTFEATILEDETDMPLFKLRCCVRISDHTHPNKKFRGRNSALVDITENKSGTRRTYSYHLKTSDHPTYDECFSVLDHCMNEFEREIKKEKQRRNIKGSYYSNN